MKLTQIVISVLSLCAITGCSINAGHFDSQSHFSYPNSNVTPLGQVKSTLTRWSFFVPPVEADDALTLVNEAIAKKPGADMMINYVLDTTTMILPLFFYKADMVVEGTAAKMEIGEQALENTLKKIEYKPFKSTIK